MTVAGGDRSGPPVRRMEVGISVDALLQQWARQDGAPAGAGVVVGAEVAARLRGGVEWRATDALAVGVVARPAGLDPDRVELGWLAASLGAATALDEVQGGTHGCHWPDRVACDGVEVVVGVTSQLGPGRVEHLGLVTRAGHGSAISPIDELETALLAGLRSAGSLLDDPPRLLAEYRHRCRTLDRVVAARLLPHGSVRGTAVAIGERGELVIESDTGFRKLVAISSFNSMT